MKRTAYRSTVLFLNIIAIILMLANLLCTNPFSENQLALILNTYISGISCSIIAVIVIYFVQIKYSKWMIKRDFRCDEIMMDISNGIKRNRELQNKLQLAQKNQSIKNDEDISRLCIEADNWSNFFSNNRFAIEDCNICFTYYNNQILIDSVQSCFFLNLNFKLLTVINHIKNRKPNLEKKGAEIQEALANYMENKNDNTALIVNSKMSSYLMDLNFMAGYMQQLLAYLGYDDAVRETFLKIYREKYPSSQEIEFEFDSPEKLKQIKEAMDEAKKTVRKQRMKDFWIK